MLEHKVVNAFRLCYSLSSMLFHVSMLGFCCAVVFLYAFVFFLSKFSIRFCRRRFNSKVCNAYKRTVQKTLSENNFEIETKTNAKAKRINRVWVTYAQLESSAGHICHIYASALHSLFSKKNCCVCITDLTQIRNSFCLHLLFSIRIISGCVFFNSNLHAQYEKKKNLIQEKSHKQKPNTSKINETC